MRQLLVQPGINKVFFSPLFKLSWANFYFRISETQVFPTSVHQTFAWWGCWKRFVTSISFAEFIVLFRPQLPNYMWLFSKSSSLSIRHQPTVLSEHQPGRQWARCKALKNALLWTSGKRARDELRHRSLTDRTKLFWRRTEYSPEEAVWGFWEKDKKSSLLGKGTGTQQNK